LAVESFRVGKEGGDQGVLANDAQRVGLAGMNAVWRHVADPAMAVNVVYQWKNAWQWARASWMDPKRAGKSGRYFSVLNCDAG
jgi:hypothetical protein